MGAGLAARRAPPWFERWRAARTPREQWAVGALAALVAVAVGWLALWQPLLRDLSALRVAVPAEKSALAEARQRADEMTALARSAPLRRASDARAELERVLAERALRAAVTQLDWQDQRVRIVFADIGADALVSLLETLDRDAQLRVVEATLTARVEPGTVRAELTLAR